MAFRLLANPNRLIIIVISECLMIISTKFLNRFRRPTQCTLCCPGFVSAAAI